MKKTIMLAALSIALPFSAAHAQKPPAWPTAAACSPGDGACPAFESEYRGQVSGVWNTLPPDLRATCVSETAAVEKSYRLLYGCLANAMQDFMKNQQRNPEGGEVVQLTPKAKMPAPEAPAASPNPAPQTQPASPAASAPTAPGNAAVQPAAPAQQQ